MPIQISLLQLAINGKKSPILPLPDQEKNQAWQDIWKAEAEQFATVVAAIMPPQVAKIIASNHVPDTELQSPEVAVESSEFPPKMESPVSNSSTKSMSAFSMMTFDEEKLPTLPKTASISAARSPITEDVVEHVANHSEDRPPKLSVSVGRPLSNQMPLQSEESVIPADSHVPWNAPQAHATSQYVGNLTGDARPIQPAIPRPEHRSIEIRRMAKPTPIALATERVNVSDAGSVTITEKVIRKDPGEPTAKKVLPPLGSEVPSPQLPVHQLFHKLDRDTVAPKPVSSHVLDVEAPIEPGKGETRPDTNTAATKLSDVPDSTGTGISKREFQILHPRMKSDQLIPPRLGSIQLMQKALVERTETDLQPNPPSKVTAEVEPSKATEPKHAASLDRIPTIQMKPVVEVIPQFTPPPTMPTLPAIPELAMVPQPRRSEVPAIIEVHEPVARTDAFGKVENVTKTLQPNIAPLLAESITTERHFSSGSDAAEVDTSLALDGERRLDVSYASASIQKPAQSPQLGTSIAAQIREAIRGAPAQHRSVEIALKPEELGGVRMTLTPSDSGGSIAILVERPETLELVQRHLESLKRELREAGWAQVEMNIGFDAGTNSETGPDQQSANNGGDGQANWNSGLPDGGQDDLNDHHGRQVNSLTGLDLRI